MLRRLLRRRRRLLLTREWWARPESRPPPVVDTGRDHGEVQHADARVSVQSGCPLSRRRGDSLPDRRRDGEHDPLHLPAGQINRATVHASVSEFRHVLSGEGQIWRRDGTGEDTTVLSAGVSIDIPVGTAFQYRCTGADPLEFLCISMPRWPGEGEATVIDGPWVPNAPDG